jgi:hypothetical protein
MGWVDIEVEAVASEFWKRSGILPEYPRSVEPAVFVTCPIAIVRLPRLRLWKAIEWLNRKGIPHARTGTDRALHGYIAARGGSGVVLIDGSDAEDEQRFTVAHEVAHFLYDYLRPRAVAVRAFGKHITEVLDGLRPATAGERLAGVLRGVPLGFYSHVRDRRGDEEVEEEHFDVEDKADQLALELLAPLADVLTFMRKEALDSPEDVHQALTQRYGLPTAIARLYGRWVLSAVRSRRSFRQWLGVT